MKDTLKSAWAMFRVLSLTQYQQQMFGDQITYDRECNALHRLIETSLSPEAFREIIATVAHGSTHENHSVPAHLQHLLISKWQRKKNMPPTLDDDIQRALGRDPFDCEERCLHGFKED